MEIKRVYIGEANALLEGHCVILSSGKHSKFYLTKEVQKVFKKEIPKRFGPGNNV